MSDDKRKNGEFYAQMPVWILRDRKLNLTDIRVLGSILSYPVKHSTVLLEYPYRSVSNGRISKDMNVAFQNVSRSIKHLCACGILLKVPSMDRCYVFIGDKKLSHQISIEAEKLISTDNNTNLQRLVNLSPEISTLISTDTHSRTLGESLEESLVEQNLEAEVAYAPKDEEKKVPSNNQSDNSLPVLGGLKEPINKRLPSKKAQYLQAIERAGHKNPNSCADHCFKSMAMASDLNLDLPTFRSVLHANVDGDLDNPVEAFAYSAHELATTLISKNPTDKDLIKACLKDAIAYFRAGLNKRARDFVATAVPVKPKPSTTVPQDDADRCRAACEQSKKEGHPKAKSFGEW
ncbi:MAG TPA: hypothetical protein VND43_05140 [Burkholderiales bacterium]|nr:hypothetical protein [Burkholderiales bacterium]